MAVLSDELRSQVTAELMRDFSAETSTGVPEIKGAEITKLDLRALVNYLDDYMNDNAAAINAGTPLPARTVLAKAQKAWAMNKVVLCRYLKDS